MYMDGSLRGSRAARQRRDVLEDFKALGVVEFPTTTLMGDRRTAQYIVRIARPDAPWRLLDGREVLPWLLGITEAAQAYGAPEDLTARMRELLAPFNAAADEVPAAVLAEALAAGAA